MAAHDFSPELARYGLSADRLDELFEAADGRVLGRIIRVERGESDVVTEAGPVRAVSDSLRAQSDLAPVTGDWVHLVDDPEVGWRIDEIVERQRTLSRRDPGEQNIEQVLVANVDRVLITQALDRPLRPGRIERFLVLAWDSGAEPAVLLTKSDVADADEVAEVRAVVEALAPGIEVVALSAVEGADRDDGIAEQLRRLVPAGVTAVLVGESGAGKSTLVNRLLGHEAQATGDVRDADGAGRHTTITRDLIPLPDAGLIIDTPGIRAVGIWDAEDALRRVFGDVIELAGGCRFNDCQHGVEPGCAVQAAVEASQLDARRLGRFVGMRAELIEQAEREAERARRADSGRRRRGGGKGGGRKKRRR
ncbi:MAG: ribosome small subunit-dependent GTPase A [Acidimicrobiales bacterium]|nr:ribosome small subunit-dependent GTPase A [Acidimicrobiales bacterium]